MTIKDFDGFIYFNEEYERLDKWRSAWYRLLQQPHSILQTHQDKIVRRCDIANHNISKLMHQYDIAVRKIVPMLYCHPKDDNKQRWILMFEDASVGNSIYDNEDEARDAFDRAEQSWNCHLFQSVRRNITNIDHETKW